MPAPRNAHPTAPRLPWLRYLALLLGGLVFIGHMITLKIPTWSPPWWDIDWVDIPKHFAMLSSFSIAYRLSWRYEPSRRGRQPTAAEQRGKTRRAADARKRAAKGRAPIGLPGPLGDALVRLKQWLALWDVPGAGLRTILVCSGWGAFCETLQIWHPYRDFAVAELSVNMLTPVLWCSLIWLVTRSGE